jgi:hypothetical protein
MSEKMVRLATSCSTGDIVLDLDESDSWDEPMVHVHQPRFPSAPRLASIPASAIIEAADAIRAHRYQATGKAGEIREDSMNRMDSTGYADGEEFESSDEVRTYFTVANMSSMFGPNHGFTSHELAAMADLVIFGRLHMAPFTDDEE